jgi:hypothetical protein
VLYEDDLRYLWLPGVRKGRESVFLPVGCEELERKRAVESAMGGTSVSPFYLREGSRGSN